MYVTNGFNKVVDNHYSGEPRPFTIKGEFFCVEMTVDEIINLTEKEHKQFRHSHTLAYTLLDDGTGRFYFQPKSRWRYLAACRQPVRIDEMRLIIALTRGPRVTVEQGDANQLLKFLFAECWDELRGSANLVFRPKATIVLNRWSNKESRSSLSIQLPGTMWETLKTADSYQSDLERLAILAEVVFIPF